MIRSIPLTTTEELSMPAYEQRILRYRTSPNDEASEPVLVFFENFTALYIVRDSASWKVVVASAPNYIKEWAGSGGKFQKVTVLGNPMTGEYLRLIISTKTGQIPRTICTVSKISSWAWGVALPPEYRDVSDATKTPSA